jgi:NAD(P)H-hydrate epimerase
VIGGCDDYVSAPALSALAAYRVGAGLVTLVVPPTIKPMIVALCREATYSSLNNHKDYEPLKTSRAILVGPGMGQSLSAQSQLASLMAYLTQKHVHCLVLDADALNLISPLDSNHTLPPRTILTPHPGEMSRLTGLSIAEIQADRIGNALKYATLWRCVVVLKGAYTVVASPDGEAVVMPFVNPAMAVAGTGDILAGAISGFAAQNVTPFTAAICGAFVHGTAGEMWRTEYGDAGLLASDLLPLLPKAIKQILAAKQNNLGV